MNLEAIKAIYYSEMARTRRTMLQSVVSPVITTALYFIVFGAGICPTCPAGACAFCSWMAR